MTIELLKQFLSLFNESSSFCNSNFFLIDILLVNDKELFDVLISTNISNEVFANIFHANLSSPKPLAEFLAQIAEEYY